MKSLRFFAPRLLAGFGTLALVASIGLFASRPAHTVGGPVPVTVSNTVQNRDSDNSARQPVGITTELSSLTPGQIISKIIYTVPANKRLVIEMASVGSQSSTDTNRYRIQLSTTVGTGVSYAIFSAAPSPAPGPGVCQPMRLYADPGTVVFADLLSNANNAPDVAVSFSGYLVDLP